MAFSLANLWPRAEVLRLRRQNEQLSVALRNATDKAAESQARLEELRNQECKTCVVLQQTVNSLMFAAGSRLPMFDGVGPTLPHTTQNSEKEPSSDGGKQRAARLVRQNRANYIQQFMEEEAHVPITEAEPF